MKEGYYWIQHVGVVQVAYYTNVNRHRFNRHLRVI